MLGIKEIIPQFSFVSRPSPPLIFCVQVVGDEADLPLTGEELNSGAGRRGWKLFLFLLGKKKQKRQNFPSPLRGTEPAPSSVLNTGFWGWKPLWVSNASPLSFVCVARFYTGERFQPLELKLGGPSGGLLGFRAGMGAPTTTTRTSFRFCPGVSLLDALPRCQPFLLGRAAGVLGHL